MTSRREVAVASSPAKQDPQLLVPPHLSVFQLLLSRSTHSQVAGFPFMLTCSPPWLPLTAPLECLFLPFHPWSRPLITLWVSLSSDFSFTYSPYLFLWHQITERSVSLSLFPVSVSYQFGCLFLQNRSRSVPLGVPHWESIAEWGHGMNSGLNTSRPGSDSKV